MEVLYLCTCSGIKGGQPYSILTRIIHGKKDNGDTYAFLDKATVREDETIQLGTVVSYTLSRSASKKSQS